MAQLPKFNQRSQKLSLFTVLNMPLIWQLLIQLIKRILRVTLDTVFEISKLLQFSPHRDAMYTMLKAELCTDVPSFHTLCPTRWTVRAASMESVVENYTVFQASWEEDKDAVRDSETCARIGGIEAAMTTFSFFFGLILGERILEHSDNLSKALQNPSLTAFEGQEMAEQTCKTLSGI